VSTTWSRTIRVPCLHRIAHRAAPISYRLFLPPEMSKLFDRATHKVKKRIGQTVDRLRPSSSQEHSRSTSPARSQPDESAPPPAAESTSSGIPAYARPRSPPTILATTGSAVKGLLVAARDGSDLFLPLKAALVGVVALWDVFDVRRLSSILIASLMLDVAYSRGQGRVYKAREQAQCVYSSFGPKWRRPEATHAHAPKLVSRVVAAILCLSTRFHRGQNAPRWGKRNEKKNVQKYP